MPMSASEALLKSLPTFQPPCSCRLSVGPSLQPCPQVGAGCFTALCQCQCLFSDGHWPHFFCWFTYVIAVSLFTELFICTLQTRDYRAEQATVPDLFWVG